MGDVQADVGEMCEEGTNTRRPFSLWVYVSMPGRWDVEKGQAARRRARRWSFVARTSTPHTYNQAHTRSSCLQLDLDALGQIEKPTTTQSNRPTHTTKQTHRQNTHQRHTGTATTMHVPAARSRRPRGDSCSRGRGSRCPNSRTSRPVPGFGVVFVIVTCIPSCAGFWGWLVLCLFVLHAFVRPSFVNRLVVVVGLGGGVSGCRGCTSRPVPGML